MKYLLPIVADYITALARSAGATRRAEELPTYQRRVAAAEIFAALERGPRLRELIDQEAHGQGLGLQEGDTDADAEAALTTFVAGAELAGANSAA